MFSKSDKLLDNIEVWTSAHITSDAEQVFYAPAAPVKIQVKKPAHIFPLIEEHSPDLLRNIPQCALSLYLKEKRDPPPKRLKLLGCELNPKQHFLEPQFSRTNLDSVSSLKTENKVLRKRNPEKLSLTDILSTSSHAVLLAPELSGKTYLLEHAESKIAESNAIPVSISKQDLETKPASVFTLVSKKLRFCNEKEVEKLSQSSPICLLVDNIDSVSSDIRNLLFAADPAQIRVICTARMLNPPVGVDTFYMEGVNLGSVTNFLRSLDLNLSQTKPFIDRAHSFIDRTLATSGLPSTPFTISIMLAECNNWIFEVFRG